MAIKLNKITNEMKLQSIYREHRELYAPKHERDLEERKQQLTTLSNQFDKVLNEMSDLELEELNHLGELIEAIEAKNSNTIGNEVIENISYLYETVRSYDKYLDSDYYFKIKWDYKRDLGNYLNELNYKSNQMGKHIAILENDLKNEYVEKEVLKTLIHQKEITIYEKILLGDKTSLKEKTIIRKIKNEIENNIKD